MNIPCAGILSLPLELLDEIIAYVANSALGVLNLRCVNKTLCSLTTPTAFRKIVVHASERSTQGFLELLVSTDIARHVRVMEFIEDPDPTSWYWRSIIYSEEGLRFEQVRNHLREAFSRLHLTPSLESLVITFFIDNDASCDALYLHALSCPHLLQIAVLGGLACNPNPLPALRSLHIHGWLTLFDDLYSEAPFKRIVESLRDLRFTVQHTRSDGSSQGSSGAASKLRDFWTNVIELHVLRPAVNLTSLAMDSHLAYAFVIPVNLDSITYPCLTSLTLARFSWYESRLDLPKVTLQVEEFIVRHGKTLKKLALHNCTIPIPDQGSAPVRPWTAVWNRFAEELTELVDLDVYWELREYTEDGLEGDFAYYDVPGTEQDSPALEALKAIVKGRKRLTYCAGDWASGV